MRSFVARLRVVARMSLQADRSLSIRTLTVSILNFLSGTVVGAFLLKLLTNAVVQRRWTAAVVFALSLAGFQGLSFLIARWHGRLYPVLQERNREYYDRKILALTARIPGIEHYENPEYLDKLEQLRNQPQVLAQMLAVTVQATSLFVQTLAVVVVLSTIDPRLMLAPLLGIPAVVAMRSAERIENAAWDDTSGPSRLTNHLFALLTTSEAAKELRMQRLEDELIRRHQSAWSQIDRLFARAHRRAMLRTTAGWMIFAVAYAGMVIVAVERAARGAATIGDVVLTVTLATQLNRQVVTVLEVVGRIVRNSRGIDRYLWLEDYARAQTPVGAEATAHHQLREGIDVRDLHFRYPATDKEVLHRVDIHFPAGRVVAIVGENGAGKTTLVKLLTGMYQPTSGSITVDGVPLRDMDLAAWRSVTSAGFQDFARFELTAGESVGIGELSYLHDDAHIVSAMRRAGAEDLVAQLPSGLSTALGTSFEEGTDLSGGQWQKIALSRAMMREAPLLLVLDEPTASLDPLAERALFERYAAWSETAGRRAGTVTILISHRFSTVRMADQIVVLNEGRVVEQGNHDELMQNDGLYAELYTLQARSYT